MRTAKNSSAGARRHRRGAAAVEFAVILPLLVTIVLGCVDFGRFAYNYIALTNAARAGAAFGCMNVYTTATQATGPYRSSRPPRTRWTSRPDSIRPS